MYPQVIEQWSFSYGQSGNRNFVEFDGAAERGFRSAGWRGALTEGTDVLLGQRRFGYASPYQIARFYADLGDKNNAFEWLNTAYSEHDYQLRQLNTDFGMDHLRPDPRFTELVHKVGLPKVR
jgi:hypothetical protein